MSEPSWDEFGQRLPAHPLPSAAPEFDDICAAVFSSSTGKRLLSALRAKYFDAPITVTADERALRVRATQQHFVHELEHACERGLAANAKRKAT